MILVTNAMRFVDRLAARTVKKSSSDNERFVIEWTPSGLVLLLVETAAPPRIKRLTRLRYDDTSLTETEKKNACQQFLSLSRTQGPPKATLCWSDGMIFRQLAFPEMPQEDLVKAFIWDLKKKFYFNADENLFGYKEVMRVESEEAPERLYNLFYCENKTALPRLDFFLGLGLDIQALIPGQAALARFAQTADGAPDKDTAVCELIPTGARILVCREDRNMLARNVTLGGESALTDEVLGRIAEEVRKTIDYYEGQKYSRPIGKAVFTGENCPPGRILDFMTPKLNIPVVCPGIEGFLHGSLDPAEKVLALSEPGLFTAALGAALVPEDTLNLVPEDIKTKNRTKRLNRFLNLGLAGFAVVLSLAVGFTALQYNWTQARMGVLRLEFEKLNENKQVLENLLNRSRVRRLTLLGDVPLHALLKDLSLRTPGAITLRQLQYNRQDETLTLQGEMNEDKRDSLKTVNHFSASLSESLFFRSAAVASTQPDEINKVLRFNIDGVAKGLSV